jgi:hypothetical protein
MREKNEERKRYVTEQFGELPVELRQAVLKHLQEKTAARRGDRAFKVDIENVSFEFSVSEAGAPGYTIDDTVERVTGPLHHR